MKINKSKSPFVGGADAPTEKDIAKAVKGDKFAEALSALESASMTDAAPSATQTALTQIASQYDLSNEQNQQSALKESAEFLVKSRLNDEFKNSEKVVEDLSSFVTDDPFLKTKLLSVLQKLSDGNR
jgi:hypothetical protein